MTASSTVGAMLRTTEERLKRGGIASFRAEAETLLAALLRKSRTQLLTDIGCVISGEQCDDLNDWLARRTDGEPLQYIVGTTGFHHLELEVGAGVLVPRPETEILVEAALRIVSSRKGLVRVLDIGTGSGNIALSLAYAHSSIHVVGVDRSADALRMARRNLARLALDERVEFQEGDLFDALRDYQNDRRFDLIVSNPPYIASADLVTLPRDVRDFEPHFALDGGPDGLSVIRRLIAQAPSHLHPGGWLIFEIGQGQAKDALSLLCPALGWTQTDVLQDLCGVERVILARFRGAEN